MNRKIQVIGHRGLPALYPENTIPSFMASIDAGVDAIELDIHLTKDDHLVVTHDGNIERCSNGKGWVADFTFDEIRRFDFGLWKNPKFAGTVIPTLKETLDAIDNRCPSMQMLLEIKPNSDKCAKMVLDMVRKRKMMERTMMLSFHNRVLRLLREWEPKLQLQGFPDRYVKESSNGDYSVLNKTCIWTREITSDEVEFFHKQNIKVDTCAVDNAEDVKKILPLNVDSITTNAAHIVVPLLKNNSN